jgi:hypothetical protein
MTVTVAAFGEIALIHESLRTATVSAAESTSLLLLQKSIYRKHKHMAWMKDIRVWIEVKFNAHI